MRRSRSNSATTISIGQPSTGRCNPLRPNKRSRRRTEAIPVLSKGPTAASRDPKGRASRVNAPKHEGLMSGLSPLTALDLV